MERKWWTMIAVSVATFMLLLDITVVNVALPSIREDLGASFTDLQWVFDAYALTLAALVLTAGSLADRLGRRRLFAAWLAISSVASLPPSRCFRWACSGGARSPWCSSPPSRSRARSSRCSST